jgi:hypothetical protein
MTEFHALEGVWVGPVNSRAVPRFFVIVPVEHKGESIGAWAVLFSVSKDEDDALRRAGCLVGDMDQLTDQTLKSFVLSDVLGPATRHPGYLSSCGLLYMKSNDSENELHFIPYFNGEQIGIGPEGPPDKYQLLGDELITFPGGGPRAMVFRRRAPVECPDAKNA